MTTKSADTQRIGILAYGSLIGDPGREIDEVRAGELIPVMTPFPVEFARSSSGRGGAPTLIPYAGGAAVRAQVLVITTSVEDAADRLYRREIDDVGSGRRYEHSDNPGPTKVVINRLKDFAGLDVVLYTQIGANIDDLNAARLAEFGIESVGKAKPGKDGISYLMNAMRHGIETPLSAAYAEAIKQKLGTSDLPGALAKAGSRNRSEEGNR